MADNPLLARSTLPHEAPPLDKVKTEDFMPALREALAKARQEVAAIINNPAAPTFENTIEALEFSGTDVGRITAIFNALSSANSNDALREMEEEFQAELVRYGNEVMLDSNLFARVKAVHDAAPANLTSPQKMLLEKSYKGFVRSGALLDDAGKKEIAEIGERLSALQTAFSNNVVKATDAYQKVIDDEALLQGVPARAKALYREAAEEAGMAGKFLIKLSPPPFDILEYAENRALREEISRALNSVAFKGNFDNRQTVMDIVRLRHRAAQMLGYPTHAHYVLEERMAKTPEAVMDFLARSENAYRPAAQDFLAQVKAFAQQEDGLADVQPWDMPFYVRKLSEKTFNLDLETLRPYFELEKVLDGVRIHAEKLFNIKMSETKGKYPVYHPDVKVYEVTDQKTGEMLALFYADYYARPGAKQNGAWMSSLRDRGIQDGVNKFPFITNTCNFDKPTKDQPSLLSLEDVKTIFHEFGHGLHGLLGKGDYSSLTGTSVKWDFVELPSQLQENWVTEKEVLDTFAVHYKTGEKMPAELIEKIRAMETFGAGYGGLRQTAQSFLDMAWHTKDPATIASVEALEKDIAYKHQLFPYDPAASFSCRFGHLFDGGYAAGYYSYKWAEVLDADVFEAFKKNGLYDRETADRLRETIYSKGGSVEPMELFVRMMGREPDPAALFRREGLAKKPKAPAA